MKNNLQKVALKKLEKSDEKRLADFLLSHHEHSDDPEYWTKRFHFWWQNNPEFREGMDRGWILVDQDKIVGFFGVIPRGFQLQGKPLTVFNTTTWVVLPDYRAKSLELFFQQNKLSKESIVFITTPNATVIQVLEKLHFKRFFDFEAAPHQSFFMLRPHKIIQYKMKKRNLPSFMQWLFIPTIFIYSWMQKKRLRKLREILSVRELKQVDSTFDDLWQRSEKQYAHTNLRTSKQIQWLCFAHPEAGRKLLGTYRDDQLVGYAIYRIHQWGEVKLFECLDLWWDAPFFEPAITSLAAKMVAIATEQKTDLILIDNFSQDIAKILKDMGFFQKNLFPNTRYYFSRRATDFNEKNTYFSKLQGDYTL